MLHYQLLADLDAALQAGSISTAYHYKAKRVMRAKQMSGGVYTTLEQVASAVRALEENGGMTERQVYNPRYS